VKFNSHQRKIIQGIEYGLAIYPAIPLERLALEAIKLTKGCPKNSHQFYEMQDIAYACNMELLRLGLECSETREATRRLGIRTCASYEYQHYGYDCRL
jgi:hypothetical protein